MEKENVYMQRMIDWKRVWLLFRKKIWLIPVITIVGALISALGYKLVDTVKAKDSITVSAVIIILLSMKMKTVSIITMPIHGIRFLGTIR